MGQQCFILTLLSEQDVKCKFSCNFSTQYVTYYEKKKISSTYNTSTTPSYSSFGDWQHPQRKNWEHEGKSKYCKAFRIHIWSVNQIMKFQTHWHTFVQKYLKAVLMKWLATLWPCCKLLTLQYCRLQINTESINCHDWHTSYGIVKLMDDLRGWRKRRKGV